jgi:hypothetical protein
MLFFLFQSGFIFILKKRWLNLNWFNSKKQRRKEVVFDPLSFFTLPGD